MYIIFLIAVTAGLVATAAYFSVFGIASMFAYNYIPAMIMGITLETGKIGVAVYLFRYWSLMTRLFKSILIMFLTALMFITSVGIFGFLSQGYQKTSEEFNILSLELKNLEEEYSAKKRRAEDINRQIEQLPTDAVGNKIRLSREYGDELAEIRDRVTALEPRMQELRVKRLAFESHIGPIAYVARMLGLPQDNVVFYAILMLVFVADPLAITLTIASNMVLISYWEHVKPSARSGARTPAFVLNFIAKARSYAREAYKGTFKALKTRKKRIMKSAAKKKAKLKASKRK